MARKADIITNNHGSIWSFHAATTRGQTWLDNYIGEDFDGFAEHGYGMDIAVGMLHAGLRLQDAATGRFARLPCE